MEWSSSESGMKGKTWANTDPNNKDKGGSAVGLDINDSAQKYTLTRMPGNFSVLDLVSLMFVGFRQIDPSLNGGIDLSKEFEEAEKLAMIM